ANITLLRKLLAAIQQKEHDNYYSSKRNRKGEQFLHEQTIKRDIVVSRKLHENNKLGQIIRENLPRSSWDMWLLVVAAFIIHNQKHGDNMFQGMNTMLIMHLHFMPSPSAGFLKICLNLIELISKTAKNYDHIFQRCHYICCSTFIGWALYATLSNYNRNLESIPISIYFFSFPDIKFWSSIILVYNGLCY
ncbi:hypothetical protein ACJX0J_023318, partial [Zea mays]